MEHTGCKLGSHHRNVATLQTKSLTKGKKTDTAGRTRLLRMEGSEVSVIVGKRFPRTRGWERR